MELTKRPRRLRRTSALRAMVREASLSAEDFIYPLFLHEGTEVEPIGAMPGAVLARSLYASIARGGLL